MHENEIGTVIIESAIELHKKLGNVLLVDGIVRAVNGLKEQ